MYGPKPVPFTGARAVIEGFFVWVRGFPPFPQIMRKERGTHFPGLTGTPYTKGNCRFPFDCAQGRLSTPSATAASLRMTSKK